MSVRAVWYGELELADALDEQIEDVGVPIVLDEHAHLRAELVVSLTAEGRLDAAGVTCAIKSSADTSCHACSLYRRDGTPLAELCRIGRRQESLCTQLAVLAHGPRR